MCVIVQKYVFYSFHPDGKYDKCISFIPSDAARREDRGGEEKAGTSGDSTSASGEQGGEAGESMWARPAPVVEDKSR